MVYIRANPIRIVRLSRCSTLNTFLIGLIFAFCLFFLAVITENHLTDSSYYTRQTELPTWGYNQSVNIEDYLDSTSLNSYLIRPKSFNGFSFCRPNTELLIMVASAPSNFMARRAIRDTWGSSHALLKYKIALVFVLGLSGNDSIQETIKEESDERGDILQDDLIDSYHNLTLKSLSMLKWTNLTCNGNNLPLHFMKTDDDMFFNIPRLLQVINDHKSAKMIGRMICGAIPVSDGNSKFYMPKYLYPEKVYPGYLSGTAYVLKGEIIPMLLGNALTTPLIHLEDIYVTGLLARKNKTYPDDSPFFTYGHLEAKDNCAFYLMVNSHQVPPNEMRFIWENSKKPAKCNPKKRNWLRRVPKMTQRLKNLCLFK